MNVAVSLQGYQTLDLLYSSSRTLVYRAIRERDHHPVVIKALCHPWPSLHDLLRFRNHYVITCNLVHPTLLRPLTLERYGRGYALVMPDTGSIACLKYWQPSSRTLARFLTLAIQLAESLHFLGQQHIIHKNIKPSNILIQPQSGQVQLIDFGFASVLPQDQQQLTSPQTLEGTLAYLSPEQTGRMNRGIDYRTDFYSLGVTLFELLTGTLPFSTQDPMELVHCHLARPIHFPSHHQTLVIPTLLQAIIAKLMAKNAEERYQSALGLKHDLEQCLHQLDTTGHISSFRLGTKDQSTRFNIPEKLYGREEAVQTLLTAFDRVMAGHCELVLVAGASGVGKTAVINEVHKPITQQRGYFIQGKFDPFNYTCPFSAFIQAFRSLMRQLLSESEQGLAGWKAKLLAAVGNNGQIMIDVMPELEYIIGPQPPVTELSGTALQNRFNVLFGQLLHMFATKDHPLVIFLDDLQWADTSSLDLLKRLMDTSAAACLLVIGAYRDHEVGTTHPLALILTDLKQQGISFKTLTLHPLSERAINRLVADTLRCPLEIAKPLSQLIYQKTQGNPFFTTQFLRRLHEDGWITFEARGGHWQCDLTQVRQLALTDDVVAFMVERLGKLPMSTQEVLKLAACMGHQFDLKLLARVRKTRAATVASDLWPALQEGFVIPTCEMYKFFQGGEDPQHFDENVTVSYQFLHDQVQQAAYALIPSDRKSIVHYQIGQLLLQQTPVEAREDHIFELVTQLNYGTDLIENLTERDNLAQLNLMACHKARQVTAYQVGRDYARAGLSLLGQQAWQRQYDMTLTFHELIAELASLCGDFEGMDQSIEIVVAHTRTLLDQVNVYRIKIRTQVSQHEFTAAITTALHLLRSLGANLPEVPTPTDVQQAVADIDQLIQERAIEDLIEIPAIINPAIVAMVQIANDIIPASHIAGYSLLCSLLTCLSVRLSITYGNIPASAYGYVTYGVLICSYGALVCDLRRDLSAGVKFGQLALQVASQPEAKAIKPEVYNAVGTFITHRNAHLKEGLQLLQAGYAAALEVGNLEFAGYNAHSYGSNALWSGQTLASLEPEIQAYYDQCLQLNQLAAANWCRLHWQVTQLLMDTSGSFNASSRYILQASEFLPQLVAAQDSTGLCHFYLYNLTLSYLFGDIESARYYATEVRRYLLAAAGLIIEPVVYFYDSLSALSTLVPGSVETPEIFQQVEQNQHQLKQVWAAYAPMNHQHKVDLVEAERCRVLGKNLEAIELYDQAISGAKANRYQQEEALANELAARFYLNWGRDQVARIYLIDAYYGYVHWGANAKVKQLEVCYPHLLESVIKSHDQTTLSQSTSATSINAKWVDVGAIIKATQAISQEVNLDSLVRVLIQITLEQTGAQKVVLLFPGVDYWQIEAIGCKEPQSLDVTLESPVNTDYDIPQTVINTVARTRDCLTLDHPVRQPQWATDPYLATHHPQSICCIPILSRNQLTGILYLENNLTSQAFSPDHLEVLKHLCAQVAISLDNARLYQALEDRVQQRTVALQESEASYRLLSEISPVGIYRHNVQGHCIYANSKLLELTGLSITEMMGSGWTRIVHPKDRTFALANWQTFVEQSHQGAGSDYRDEIRLIRPDGSLVWICLQAVPQRSVDGELTGYVGTVVDITESKQTQAALAESEITLRSVLENAPSIIVQVDRQGYIQFINRVAPGFTFEEVVGSHFNAFVAPECQAMQSEAIEHVFKTGQSTTIETVSLGANRSVAHYEVRIAPLWGNEQVESAILIATDITERKHIELSLQDSEARFRAFFEQAAVGIAQASLTGQFTNVNHRLCEILGYGQSELLGKTFEEITHPEDRVSTHDSVQQLLAGDITAYSLEKRYLCRDQQVRWVHVTVSVVREESGSPQYFIGVVEDIHVRKQAETALQDSEAQTRLIIDSVPALVAYIDTQQRYRFCNQYHAQWVNQVESMIKGKPIQEVMGVDNYQLIRPQVQAALSGQMVTFEPELTRPDGSKRHYLATYTPHFAEEGEVLGFFALVQDQTERKQAELVLREQQEFIQRVAITSPSYIYIYDVTEQRNIYANRDLLDILGYSTAEVQQMGSNLLPTIIHPDDLERIFRYQTTILAAADGEVVDTVYRTHHKNGDWRWLHGFDTPFKRDDQGNVTQYIGAILDITDRKLAEESLLIAQRVAQVGNWECNQVKKEITWSAEMFRIYGLDPAQGEPTFTELVQRVQPEYRAYYQEVVDRAITEGIPYHIDLGILRPDGSTGYVNIRGEVEFNTQGQVTRLFGTVLDISERKNLEHALQQLNRDLEQRVSQRTQELAQQTQLLQTILNSMGDGVIVANSQGEIVLYNPAAEQRSPDSSLPSLTEQLPLLQAVGGSSQDRVELTLRNRLYPEGIIVEVTSRTLRNEANDLIGGLVVFQDISARKQAEEALKESEQRFRRAIANAPFPIMIHAEGGEVLQINGTWTEITGYTHQDIPTIQAWAKRAYGHRAEDILKTTIITKYDLRSRWEEGEFLVSTRDGNQRIWQFSTAPLGPLPDDRQVVITIAVDVTQRRQAEIALCESEERYRSIFEQAAVGLVNATLEGKLLKANPRFCEMLGYSTEELLTKTVSEITYPDDRDHFAPEHQRLFAGEVPYFIQEKRYLCKDGGYFWSSTCVSVVRDASGQPKHALAVIRDISDRKQVEAERENLLLELSALNQKLEGANQQLSEYSYALEQKVEARTSELKAAQERIIAQEKLASLGTLTAGVAHELRNPLNFVKNYAEGSVELSQDLLETLQPFNPILDAEALTTVQLLIADLQENATTIRHHSQRATQVIESMMQHTHTDYEQATPQSTHLHSLLDQAVKLAYHSKRVLENDFNLSIRTDYTDALETITVVPGNLLRALINLIDNACDAMSSKHRQLWRECPQKAAEYTPTLWLSTRILTAEVEIRIRDNGCGIDPAIQAQIMDPFFTTKPPGEGTGLGLSLTHDIIVKQHQGSMKLVTQQNDFTEIILTLPWVTNETSAIARH